MVALERFTHLVNEMKNLLSVVVVLAVIYARGIESLPTGAPSGACDNLTPLRNPAGHADPPQMTTVPYMINLTPFNNSGTWQYTPGTTYTCKLIHNYHTDNLTQDLHAESLSMQQQGTRSNIPHSVSGECLTLFHSSQKGAYTR